MNRLNGLSLHIPLAAMVVASGVGIAVLLDRATADADDPARESAERAITPPIAAEDSQRSDAPGTHTMSETRLDLQLRELEGSPEDFTPVPVQWVRLDDTSVSIAEVSFEKTPSGSSLRLVLLGTWNPELSGRPEVFGDDAVLQLIGVGNYLAVAGGPQTAVEVALPNAELPGRLRVLLRGTASEPLAAEVELTP